MGWIGDVYPQWVWLNNHANDESDPRVFLCRGLAISTCFIPCPTGEESEERSGRLLSCWDLAQDARAGPRCQVRCCAWKRTWGILMDQILILPNIFPTIPKTKLSVVQQYKGNSHVFAFQIASKLCDNNIDTNHSWSFWRRNDSKLCDEGANDQHFGAYQMIW